MQFTPDIREKHKTVLSESEFEDSSDSDSEKAVCKVSRHRDDGK